MSVVVVGVESLDSCTLGSGGAGVGGVMAAGALVVLVSGGVAVGAT